MNKTTFTLQDYLDDFYSESLDEAIERHTELNPKLFGDDELLKPEVLDKINEIVDVFVDDLVEDDISIVIDDIILIGSNVSYNYTDDSDLDIHIVANTTKTECPDNLYPKLYSAYRTIFNKNHEINFYGIPVEIFVETEESARVSNGIYSVKNNKWIKEPVLEDIPEVDYDKIKAALAPFEKRYQQIINKPTIAAVDKLLTDIYNERLEGLKDSEYNIRALTFKEFRNKGYLDNLKELRNELISNELSLESFIKENCQVISEQLSNAARTEARIKITQVAHTQPIIQDNGNFKIYNVAENEYTTIMTRLRELDFIDQHYLTAIAGRFDFRNISPSRLPSRYYTISGKIIEVE